MSPIEAANKLATHFASISCESEPLNFDQLPPYVKDKIRDNSKGPEIHEYEVHRKILAAKKPQSSVAGDIPVKLVKEFAVELSKPVGIIFNAITESGEYPRQWVQEEQVVIPKSKTIESFESLRSLSKTAFFSKVYESFIRDWIMPFISPFLDSSNFGGLKGDSPSYYLINLLHFIHSHLDQKVPHAVLLAQADLKRAFNSVSHRNIIIDLCDMMTPGWILKIIYSYLSHRNMVMKFRGATSSRFELTGSCPQGVFLSIIFFIETFNGAFLLQYISWNYSTPSPTPIHGWSERYNC